MEKNNNAQIQYTNLMIAAEKGVVVLFLPQSASSPVST